MLFGSRDDDYRIIDRECQSTTRLIAGLVAPTLHIVALRPPSDMSTRVLIVCSFCVLLVASVAAFDSTEIRLLEWPRGGKFNFDARDFNVRLKLQSTSAATFSISAW